MKHRMLASALMVLVVACASGGSRLSDNERLEIHRQHAGEPVRSFHNFGTLYNWTALGDRALAVWTRRNQAYLLELGGSCPDLEFSRTISFTGQGGTVFAGMDNVLVLDRAHVNFPCRIKQIRPLDAKAVEGAERNARDGANASDRTDSAVPGQSSSGGT